MEGEVWFEVSMLKQCFCCFCCFCCCRSTVRLKDFPLTRPPVCWPDLAQEWRDHRRELDRSLRRRWSRTSSARTLFSGDHLRRFQQVVRIECIFPIIQVLKMQARFFNMLAAYLSSIYSKSNPEINLERHQPINALLSFHKSGLVESRYVSKLILQRQDFPSPVCGALFPSSLSPECIYYPQKIAPSTPDWSHPIFVLIFFS